MTYHQIVFDFKIDQSRLQIQLMADAEVHHSDTYYIVKNFRLPGSPRGEILPPIQIKKAKGRWVHTDSGKSTDLSEAVGHAIDQFKDWS